MNQPNVQGLIIPLSGRFKRIMKHYPEEFPNLGRSQLFHFNTVLRELGEEAKIADLVQLYKSTNTGYDEEQVPKFSLLSSHTARRTFCTLKFLAGMPVESIMRFSGHTTERNFLKYLRLDNELNAAQFRKFF
jgi:integrase